MTPRIGCSLRLSVLGALCLAGFAEHAAASCASPSGFFTGYSYVVSPGGNTPQSIESTFWALGYGDPTVGAGADNGGWEDTEPVGGASQGWLRRTTVNYLAGDWSSSTEIDGCIEGRIAPGHSREVMAVAFTDAESWTGHFAVAAVERADWSFFDFTFPGQDIALVPIPRPSVVTASRTGQHEVQAQVRGPTLQEVAAGVYSDGTVAASEVVSGFRLYKHPAGGPYPPPPDRSETGWTSASAITPLGQTVTITVDCGCHSQAYLATSLVFDGGFETRHLSQVLWLTCSPPLCEYWPWPDFDEDGYTLDPCCGLGLDCDDANPEVHPGATEVCNGIDDDCNVLVDEDANGEDSDADTIHNLCDNCVLAPNPTQHDLDQDAEGDACDLADGLILVRFDQPGRVDWQQETGFLSWNAYRGDLDVLKTTGVYTQLPGSNDLAGRACDLLDPNAPDNPSPESGKVAFILVTGNTAAGEGSLGATSGGIERPNTNPCP